MNISRHVLFYSLIALLWLWIPFEINSIGKNNNNNKEQRWRQLLQKQQLLLPLLCKEFLGTLVVIKFYPLPCFQCTIAATRLFIYSRTMSRDYIRDQVSFHAREIKIPCKPNTQTSICLLFLSFYSVRMNTFLGNGIIGSRKGLRIVRLINSWGYPANRPLLNLFALSEPHPMV